MRSKAVLTGIKFLCLVFIFPLETPAQCFTAPYGQKPATVQTIANCNGSYQTFLSDGFAGEYSKINVTAGYSYSFKSSKGSDYITISDNDGTIAYATGLGHADWTATLTTVVRFYTHKDVLCATKNDKRKRQAWCKIPPCTVPGAVSSSNIANTTATISWGASASAVNGYQYEIRTSGAGGSGSTGLVTSGSTLAGETTTNVTGLTAGTTYTAYVRSNCIASQSSYVSGSFTTTGTAPNPVPAFNHIVVVIGENTNASAVFGNSSAPYINALAAAGAKFTNSFALFHPSQPNYIALYSGSNQGSTNDNFISTKFTTANLGRELINAGKTYTTYSEGLPSVGYDGNSSGLYVRKHNPAANWMGSGTNQIPTTTNQPFTAFPSDFNNLPSVSFVIPDLCSDGHDVCAPLNNRTLQYDNWIQTRLDAYKQWAVNNNSLLIVTYDEDDFTSTNKIATVFYGANVATGTYTQTINHYNVLRTIEEAFRLTSHAGAAATATPIGYCWVSSGNFAPVAELTVRPAETSSEKTITVFPNPAHHKIAVLPNDMKEGRYINWEIVDITGIKLMTGKIFNSSKGSPLEIATGNLRNGLYLVHISDGITNRVSRFIIAR